MATTLQVSQGFQVFRPSPVGFALFADPPPGRDPDLFPEAPVCVLRSQASWLFPRWNGNLIAGLWQFAYENNFRRHFPVHFNQILQPTRVQKAIFLSKRVSKVVQIAIFNEQFAEDNCPFYPDGLKKRINAPENCASNFFHMEMAKPSNQGCFPPGQ